MQYKIRKKEKKDCKIISHIVTITWQETYKGIVDKNILDNLPNTEEFRTNQELNNFNEKENHDFILEVNNEIVGFIKVGITNDKTYSNCGETFALYILKEYQKYGFGKALIKTGIKELKKLGCNKMLIGCLKGNPSNEFYKHIGGTFIKTRPFKLPSQELIENIYLFEDI